MTAEDHDVLLTLVANVSNLKESQEKFHSEMRTAMEDLRNNYSWQLSNHETRLNKLENSRVKINTLLSVGIGILTLLVSILVYHVMQK